MTADLAYSRPQATADRVADYADDYHRFIEKQVLLTGEAAILATPNGRMCLLDSLRLLIRICPNISVSLPTTCDTLLEECSLLANKIAFGTKVEFHSGQLNFAAYDAILNVGTIARADLPWTAINSNGWLARISSVSANLSGQCEQRNPIGALAAASLGTAEVFKRLINLKPSRGRFFDGLVFSLFSYRCGEDDPGPPLPKTVDLNLLLVGAGAIGNGVIHLASQLPVAGKLWIVDSQAYGEENLGTCLLIGPQDVGKDKATLAAEILQLQIETYGFREDFTTFSHRLGMEVQYPSIVINALDNIDARHTVQKTLWPDLILDGAIGDFGCQVSCHPWGEDVACLMCLFQKPSEGTAEYVASQATGLSLARVQEASAPITEADVQAAPMKKQHWLKNQIGRQICSVVQEAITQQLSIENQRKGFEPSVAFVACLSASMVVTELIKHMQRYPTELKPRFQFDVLRGPAYGQEFAQRRRDGCSCVIRQHNIEKMRQRYLIRKL